MEIRTCAHCGKCKAACPTGILRGEGADCLSAITQKKGELSEDEKALMRKYNTAWGCDICQTVCPYNRTPMVTPIAFFKESLIPNLTSDCLEEMSKEAFAERAFAWRGRATVARNIGILEEK
jgi:epoxyqueuosine reductase QueG